VFAFHLREPPQVREGILHSADTFTIRHVRTARIEPGERFALIFAGARVTCELISVGPLHLTARVISEEHPEKPNPSFIFAFAALKGGKSEDVLFSLTQLSVDVFILFASARTVARRPSEERVERYRKKVLEACEVSGIVHPPAVLWADGVTGLLEMAEEHACPPSHRLLFYERESSTGLSLKNVTSMPYDGRACFAVIGPEGGFEDAEVRAFADAGFQPVTLGSRVLEARVAAYYAASCLSAWMGKLK